MLPSGAQTNSATGLDVLRDRLVLIGEPCLLLFQLIEARLHHVADRDDAHHPTLAGDDEVTDAVDGLSLIHI